MFLFPTLISIGPIAISTLGVFMVLGFILGSFLIWKRGKEEGYDESELVDGIFLLTIIGLIGARIWYVFWHFADFENNLFRAFSIIRVPGFSWFGAFLAGLFALAVFANKKKWDFFQAADLFVFGLTLGQIFGLIGSFFDGSFYGKPTNLPWGIRFPGLDQPRHPTQFYLLLIVFLILRLLFVFDKNYRTYEWYKDKRGEADPGFLFLAYLIMFSLGSLFVGLFREQELTLFGLFSWDQFFWLLTFSLAVGLLYSRSGIDVGKFKKLKPQKKDLKVLGDYKEPVVKRKIKKAKFHLKTGMEAKK